MGREEYLLGQILAELRKKPSAWQTADTVQEAGGLWIWEVGKQISNGIYEVYVLVAAGNTISLNAVELFNQSFVTETWFPAEVFMSAIFDGAVVQVLGSYKGTLPQGFLVGPGDILSAGGNFKVRFRRRFERCR